VAFLILSNGCSYFTNFLVTLLGESLVLENEKNQKATQLTELESRRGSLAQQRIEESDNN